MKTQTTTTNTNTQKRLVITCSIVASLLMVPLIAMQFSNEVKWDLFDFIVAGGLLLFAGLGIEMITRKINSKNLKIALCLGVLLLLFLIWAELAVGIFGSPIAGS